MKIFFGIIVGLLIAFALVAQDPVLRTYWRIRMRRTFGLGGLASRLGAVMVAASAVVIRDRPGGFHFTGSFTLDPGAIAAGGREVETVAVPGVNVGDVCYVSPQYATSLIVGYCTCRVAGTIEFSLENNTAGALDEAANTWNFAIIRGSTAGLRVNT